MASTNAAGSAAATAASDDGGHVTSNALGPVKLCPPSCTTDKDSTRPKWYPPAGSYRTGLRVHNTLTEGAMYSTDLMDDDGLVEFIPANGRKVLWYTCGPTVYDSAHMGHARAYLTFDILRRIMEDYFRYDVTYQINVTDIDDKIILRARRNKLIEDYEREVDEGGSDDKKFDTVMELVTRAMSNKSDKLQTKLETASQPLKANANSRDVAERETTIKETELKLNQLKRVQMQVDQIKTCAAQGGSAEGALEALRVEANLPPDDGGGKAEEGENAEKPYTVSDAARALLDALEKNAPTSDDGADEATIATHDQRTARAEALFLASTHTPPPSNIWKSLLTIAKDELGELLDTERGSTITSHDVFNAHARYYEREFMEDMSMLGVHEPDVITRVTEYLPEIVDFINGIVAKGLAYESNGSVYLSIDDFKQAGHEYRKLVPSKGDTTDAEMAEGEGALGGGVEEKRNKNDFALWKSSKPGEPSWDSPWGPGRPGWHIECSVVASDILGQNMDVHAGGTDLKFPHHDNELAQSEARFGCCQWVNYFFHAGHLHIKGLKMSKSLKNFITIRQALQEHSARQLRLMFLLQPWDKPMNYSDQTVNEARTKESLFNNFFGDVKALLRTDWLAEPVGFRDPDADRALMRNVHETQTKVHEALCRNFDTPSAVLALCDLVSDVNKYLRRGTKVEPHVVLVRKAARYVSSILRVFGVIAGSDEIGFRVDGGSGGERGEGGEDREETIKPFVQSLIDFRDKVRKAAQSKADPGVFLAACDEVRDETMTKLGVRLEDKADETIWKLDDPKVLMRELQLKREAEAERKAAKAAKRRAALQKDLDKWEAARVPPVDFFKTGDNAAKFAAFDEATGMPLRDKEGKEINKSGAKKLQKQLKGHEKLHGQLMEKSNGDVDGFIEEIRRELAELSTS